MRGAQYCPEGNLIALALSCQVLLGLRCYPVYIGMPLFPRKRGESIADRYGLRQCLHVLQQAPSIEHPFTLRMFAGQCVIGMRSSLAIRLRRVLALVPLLSCFKPIDSINSSRGEEDARLIVRFVDVLFC